MSVNGKYNAAPAEVAGRVHRREPRAHCHSAPRRWRYKRANPGRTAVVPRAALQMSGPRGPNAVPRAAIVLGQESVVRTAVRNPGDEGLPINGMGEIMCGLGRPLGTSVELRVHWHLLERQ